MTSSRTTELKAQIRDAEARYDALLDAAVDAIIQIDANGHIERFNHAAERIFGYRFDEVKGQNVKMLMPQPYQGEHDGYIKHYVDTGQARIIGIGREVKGLHKDGHTFPIELSVGDVQEGDHKIFVGIIRDISERKLVEKEAAELRESLAHVARVGSMGEMASGLAHELNQPLTAIASYARASKRMLEQPGATPAQYAQTLEKIADQAERAGEIIRRLRGFLRRSGGPREAQDCNAIIRELLTLLEIDFREHPFRLRLELGKLLPMVAADRIQLQQVLLNLVRNAIDAMSEFSSGNEIVISSSADEDNIMISISDCGPGISEDKADLIFEPFFTTKCNGMGIGLALCKTIMRAHGGDLTATNNPEGGACFMLRLPIEKTV